MEIRAVQHDGSPREVQIDANASVVFESPSGTRVMVWLEQSNIIVKPVSRNPYFVLHDNGQLIIGTQEVPYGG